MTTHAIPDTTLYGARQAAPLSDSLPRFGAATGVLGFALAIGATAAEIANAYVIAASPQVWTGAMLQITALLCLFGFATYLGSALRHTLNDGDWLPGLTAAGGQAFVGLTLAGFAIGSVARFRAGPGVDISALTALFDIHVALYVASWALGAMFMAAAAGAGLRSKAFPGWLCAAAGCVAAVNVAAVALPTTPVATFPNLLIWLWTLAAGVTLLVRHGRAGVSEAVRP